MSSTWKQTERRICKALGVKRMGAVGAEGPDGMGDHLCVEIKHRKRVSRFLTDTLAKVRHQCRPDQLGIVVLHEHGSHGADDLVLMALSDYVEWYGRHDPERDGDQGA